MILIIVVFQEWQYSKLMICLLLSNDFRDSRIKSLDFQDFHNYRV